MKLIPFAAFAIGAVCLALMAPSATWAAEPSKAAQQEAAQLVATLKSTASVYDKAKACQRLAVVGDAAAVPALAALLADERLSHYARYALEAIPDPAVDEALRSALGRLAGSRLIGALGTIARRRDAEAVDNLKSLVSAPNAAVAEAAANALGYVGNRPAAEILQQEFAVASADRRAALADAILVCAQRLLSENEQQLSVELCDIVVKADLPKHLVLGRDLQWDSGARRRRRGFVRRTTAVRRR